TTGGFPPRARAGRRRPSGRPRSPPEAAGIERGDVLLASRGAEITDLRALPRAVSATAAGTRVPILLVRDGRRMTVDVQVAEEPMRPLPARERPGRGVERYRLAVQGLPPALRARLGVEGPGVLVAEVERGLAADRAGLRPGDVILEADRQRVQGIVDLALVLEGGRGPTLLFVQRGEDTIFLTLSRAG